MFNSFEEMFYKKVLNRFLGHEDVLDLLTIKKILLENGIRICWFSNNSDCFAYIKNVNNYEEIIGKYKIYIDYVGNKENGIVGIIKEEQII